MEAKGCNYLLFSTHRKLIPLLWLRIINKKITLDDALVKTMSMKNTFDVRNFNYQLVTIYCE